MAEKQNRIKVAVFEKADLIRAQRFGQDKDIISALFEDGKSYTITEVEKKINQFKKGETK